MWRWAALVALILIWIQIPKTTDAWANFKTDARRIGNAGHLTVRTHKVRDFRILQCGESVIGGIWLKDKTPLFKAFLLEAAVTVAKLSPATKRDVLQIGLGIGSVTSLILDPEKWDPRVEEVHLEVVEIDHHVEDLAREYFDLPNNVNVTIDDGRAFIARQKDASFDVIIHDVYTAGRSSKHTMTLEAFRDAKRVLKSGGIFTFIGTRDEELAGGTDAIMWTLLNAFEECRFFPEAPFEKEDLALSIVAFCSDSRIAFSPSLIPLQDFETWEWKRLEGDFRCARTIIISDNENPLDEMQQPVQEKLWRQVHKMLQ